MRGRSGESRASAIVTRSNQGKSEARVETEELETNSDVVGQQQPELEAEFTARDDDDQEVTIVREELESVKQ